MRILHLMFLVVAALLARGVTAADQEVPADKEREKLDREVRETIALLKKTDSGLKKFFDESAGYAVFPRITKGAVGLGAAHGNGQVFEKGKLIGSTDVKQVTIGVQFGGQVYAEVVFFEDQKTLDDFKRGNVEFSAQLSAVAAAEGASTNARYKLGVAVFTIARGGLMYEASIGGQKFSFEAYPAPAQ